MINDPWQLDVLARTVYGESRGESYAGQVAVASVVLNRVRAHPRWPASIAAVCLQPRQFSAWNDPTPLASLASDDPGLGLCRAAARAASDLKDSTNGANHYLTADLAAGDPPSWYDPAKITARIGRHVFLRL